MLLQIIYPTYPFSVSRNWIKYNLSLLTFSELVHHMVSRNFNISFFFYRISKLDDNAVWYIRRNNSRCNSLDRPWIQVLYESLTMVVRVFIQKWSCTWSRLIKMQYLWDLSQKIVWQVEWSKKPLTAYFLTTMKGLDTVESLSVEVRGSKVANFKSVNLR